MKQSTRKLTVAASTFVAAALLSFSWSEQSGISLSVEKAEARVGRPLTPVSVAGVARRQDRRAAIGTAAAVGAVGATGWGTGYYGGGPYYGGAVRGAQAAYYGGSAYTPAATISNIPHYAVTAYRANGPWYGYNGWTDYSARNGIKCTPGTMVKLDDGLMHVCQ